MSNISTNGVRDMTINITGELNVSLGLLSLNLRPQEA
jgi:hypothetical protein